MSGTPRTDAHIELVQQQHQSMGLADMEHYIDMTGQLASIARQLERELNESRRQHAADNKELNDRLTKQQADMQARIVKLREQLTRWETELTKVMPPDFKDWHQNSRDEWPKVARIVIENLREREAWALDQAAQAGVWQSLAEKLAAAAQGFDETQKVESRAWQSTLRDAIAAHEAAKKGVQP